MVERFNWTILNSLSLLVSSNQQDWDKNLPFYLLAYRSPVHETTSYSPSQMLFGRDLCLPADLLFNRPPDAPLAPEEYIKHLQAWMEELHHLARERMGIASEKMKTQYDARATGHNFHEGNKVWLWYLKHHKGLSPKLQINWEGPYKVLKRLNDVVVRIQKSLNSKPKSNAIHSGSVLISTSEDVLCAFSKSGKKQAILREKKTPEEKLFLEIWNGSKKEITFDMTERKEHGKISKNDPFKCFEWSSDEKFLLYAAEEKQPKSVSYFKDVSQNNGGTESPVMGEEYVYREEWGEVCVGDHHKVLCLLDLRTGSVEVLPTSKIGSDISFGQGKWGPGDESIIFIGWKEFPYRLGVWACRNRRSSLYVMNLKSKQIGKFF
ncbi:acylamino-acid-releasing enzyme [Trichonephila clavipes]|nr:acylamino-acid-releasing enzyme [Trichonephila clavipes]